MVAPWCGKGAPRGGRTPARPHHVRSLWVAGVALTLEAIDVSRVVIVKSDDGSTERDSISGTPLMPFARDAVARSDVPVASEKPAPIARRMNAPAGAVIVSCDDSVAIANDVAVDTHGLDTDGYAA